MNKPHTQTITGDELANHNALLNVVSELLNCKNDAALSRALDVMPPVISKIRHGYLDVGPTLQLTLLDIGIPLVTIRRYVPFNRRTLRNP